MLSNNENIFSNVKAVRAGKYRFQPGSNEMIHYIAEPTHFKFSDTNTNTLFCWNGTFKIFRDTHIFMFSDTNKIALFCWNRTLWDENNFFIILINEIRNIAEAAHFDNHFWFLLQSVSNLIQLSIIYNWN